MPEERTGRERLEWLKRGHMPLVQVLFDEAYACGHKDGRADGEAVIGMLEAARSELADAQRWAMIRDTVTRLDAESRPGLPMGDDDIEQVVLRVLERTARKPAPVAPQVVRLHQAYEGTTTCFHCGEPMPWSEMEICPRTTL